MTFSRRAHRHRLRHSALATAAVLALLSSPPTLADSTVTISVSSNSWIGGTSDDWFTASNWEFGGLFNLPSPVMPVYIGPLPQTVNGFPVAPKLPVGEAVLGGVFNAPSLTMHAWDGPSQLRLVAGGLLTTSGTVGGLNSFYAATGAIQAATLVLDGGQIAGSWSFLAHSRVVVNGNYGLPSGSWSGDLGELTVNAGAAISLPSGLSSIGRVQNAGTIHVANSGSLNLAGTVTGAGTLNLASAGSITRLTLAADTTLAGTGQTVLGDRAQNIITSNSASRTLTIGAGHTVRGGGNLGSSAYSAIDVVNQGTLLADAPTSGMRLYVGSFDNSAGTVQVAAATTLTHDTGALSGGTVQSLGTGATLAGAGSFTQTVLQGGFNLLGGTYTDVTLRDANTLGNGGNVSVGGTLTNTGTLTLASAGSITRLNLATDTTLAGTGQTVLGDRAQNIITSNSAGRTLTIGAGHTVRGGGNLGSGAYSAISVVNQGTLLADAAGGMRLYTDDFNNTGGSVQVADGSFLLLGVGSLSGGTVQGTGTAYLTGGGVYRDTTLSGSLKVNNSDNLQVAGTITNNGTLNLASAGSITRLTLAADTTLAGTGQTVLGDRAQNIITSNSASRTLTIGAGHTVRGGGNLGSGAYSAIDVVNQGTLLVDNGVMRLYTNQATDNQGRLQVNTGAELNATSSGVGIVQTTADATTIVNGLLKAPTLTLNAGTLQGSGTVQADVLNLGGTINAGNSPGKLSITGDLTLGDDSLLLVEVAGPVRGTQYDWLAVSGNVVLDGDLRLVFTGYTPQVGEQFSFLTSGGGFSGRFDNAWANGWALDLQYGAQGVTATVTAVPEPGSWALMLLGAAGLGAWLRRRQAASTPNAA